MIGRLPFTKALRAMLQDTTGRPVGLGRYPTDSSGQVVATPYAVLFPIPGTTYDGPPLWDAFDTPTWQYQVTSVGARADQAEWMGDRVRVALLDRLDGRWTHELVVPGLLVLSREHVADGGADSDGGTVSQVDRFAFTVTGAAS